MVCDFNCKLGKVFCCIGKGMRKKKILRTMMTRTINKSIEVCANVCAVVCRNLAILQVFLRS